MKKYNWGIIGTGKISHHFAQGLSFANGSNLYCVASRSLQKAQSFANEYSVPVAYGSYEELAQDPHVDIVYIGTPNSLHCENAILCLNHKKAVLCEKPFAISTKQVREMIFAARANNVFLMEALWTNFLPSIKKVKELLNEKIVGDPICIKADFGFYQPFDKDSRLFSPALGGGSLLDIGIYPVFLALSLFGFPNKFSTHCVKAPTGVDLSTGIFLSWNSGQFAQLASSFAVQLGTEAVIYCTGGTITLHKRFHMPTTVSVTTNDKTWEIPIDWVGNGYNYEADEVMRCLANNQKESALLPHSFSLNLMHILESVLQMQEQGGCELQQLKL